MKRLPRSIEKILEGKYRVEWNASDFYRCQREMDNVSYNKFIKSPFHREIMETHKGAYRWVSIYELAGLIQQTVCDLNTLSTFKKRADMDRAVSIIYDEMERYR